MTLVLTQLSDAGIAMVADSAISMVRNGQIMRADQQSWEKLLWVPRIGAGVSYWGLIGRVAPRFDRWLKLRIESSSFNNLRELADFLAAEMNAACRGTTLGKDEEVGIHVAGYHEWSDQKSRPTFFHVHNGHLKVKWRKGIRLTLPSGGVAEMPTDPEYVKDARKPFQRHDDFPMPSASVAHNEAALKNGGYITRNGDFATYLVITEALRIGFASLNASSGVSIPSDPKKLGPQLGFLKMELETIAQIYKCSSLPRIVGGKIMTLGIKPDGMRYTG